MKCQNQRNNPIKVEGHIWEPPAAPFDRVHIDFAGPFLGKTFLILVDAFTKWPEVHFVPNMLSENTILKGKEIFVQYGIPKILVSVIDVLLQQRFSKNFYKNMVLFIS